jgi:periplasmic protein TonB
MNAGGRAFGAGAYAPLTSADLDDRFGTAVIFSIIVHVLFIFGVQFTQPNPKLFEQAMLPLEVVLVNARSESKPLKPDVLAQVNLDGGGDVEEDRQAKSPLPVSPQDTPASAEAETRPKLQSLLQRAKQVLTQAKSAYTTPDSTPEPPSEARPPVPTPAPSDLAARSLEMARLQAKIDAEWDAYQKRPRKMFVGARAQEYSAARYVEDWRMKVERIGNQNYPEAARRNHMYGSLILEVCIKPDGALYRDPLGEADNPAVVKSSGSKVLDAAAMRIVEMSSPFAAFSPELLEMMRVMGRDVFCITRTWSFTRDDQLTSK